MTVSLQTTQESTGSAAAGVPSRFEERSEYDGRLRFLPSHEKHASPPELGTRIVISCYSI